MRPATSADLGDLTQLATVARSELLPERGGPMWLRLHGRPDPVEATLAADLAEAESGHGLVLLGTIDGVPAGYAVAHLEDGTDGRLATVTDVFVEPPFRDVGLGAALMDAVLSWATDIGCRGVDSLVLPGMRASKNFFERYGLTARAILVHRDLMARPIEPTGEAEA